jgi:hypothetical protein
MVIPAMDHIDTTFTNGILNADVLEPAIRAALKLAKKTLNRYYSLTDASETYRVAMGELSSILPSCINFIIFPLQSFIPKTNFNTSGTQAGRQSGSQQLKISCVSCMTGRMLHEQWLMVSTITLVMR